MNPSKLTPDEMVVNRDGRWWCTLEEEHNEETLKNHRNFELNSHIVVVDEIVHNRLDLQRRQGRGGAFPRIIIAIDR